MTNLVTVATRRLARLVGRAQPSVPSRDASFVGIATLTTSRPDVRGPFARPVSADLCVDANGGVTVTSVYVEPVKFGSVTCAITLLPGTWRGTYAQGELQLVLGLHLGVNVLRGAEDSDITLTLTTTAAQGAANGPGLPNTSVPTSATSVVATTRRPAPRSIPYRITAAAAWSNRARPLPIRDDSRTWW